MPVQSEFVSYLLELLEPLGPVRAKAMFGGYGIYCHDLMFGLVADETFYLKADENSRGRFESRGLQPFRYHQKGRPLAMSYYQAPPEAMENAEELCRWARQAYEAAVRAAQSKRRRG